RILTRMTLRNGIVCEKTGTAVIVRAERRDLTRLADLRGQRIAAVAPNSFNGWITVQYELERIGINAERHLKHLVYPQTPQHIALALMRGQVDAGVVRADEVEHVVTEGNFRPNELRVLAPRPHDANYPYESTTPLYPEWPLAVMRHTPDDLARRVVLALLKLT